MTREEAIRWFKESPFYHKDHEPFNMAIKALEQESVTDFADRCEECGKTIKQKYTDEVIDKIRSDIEDWQTDIHDNEYDADTHDFVFERIYEIIDEYKAESEG